MIIATTTERGTDEDTESSSRVTRSIVDNYMHRPSVDDRAVRALATMANNDLTMMSVEDEEPPLCDASFIFISHNKARFLLSGDSVAYHFEDGRLVHRSRSEGAPIMGSGPHYNPRMEDVFDIGQNKNAFLSASPALARAVSDQQIEEALRASESPKDWMSKLEKLAGDDTQFCAITFFLPQGKQSRLRDFLDRAMR